MHPLDRQAQDLLDEVIRVAPPIRNLRECYQVNPPSEVSSIVQRSIERALQLGLVIPRYPRLRVGFVVEPGEARGQASLMSDGCIDLILNLAECRNWFDLASVALHELRHVHDFAAGNYADKVAFERRAREFAIRAMDGWRP